MSLFPYPELRLIYISEIIQFKDSMAKDPHIYKCYQVIRSHQSDSTDPLIVSKGDQLQFERRQTKWDGWLWCWKTGGVSGWVPEPWVEIEGDTCRMKQDYDATELSVDPGDVLRPLLTVSSWLMAVSPAGVTGWVPLECVEPTDSITA
jgi:hypothetical protein